MKRHLLIGLLVLLALPLVQSCGREEWVEPMAVNQNSQYVLNRPEGFPAFQEPEDNPATTAGVDLGRRLFYDPILSADSTQSCGSCHNQAHGFTDNGLQFSTGIDGIQGDKNSMQIINLLWSEAFFWDGRQPTLEIQALDPVTNPIEMHDTWPNVVDKLSRHDTYPGLFQKAFGSSTITKELAAKAISQFERSLISGDTRYHRYLYGRPDGELTDSELRGMVLFFGEKAECFHCHVDVEFTDHSFRNNGLESSFPPEHQGLGAVTGDEFDYGKFKTPTLINIAFTAPYMHDGRFQTLEEVVDHYSSGVKLSPTLDPLIRPGGFALSDDEKADLVAFMKTLTDEDFLTNPAFSNPFQ